MANQRKERNIEKYMGYRVSLTIWVYRHSFSRRWLPNLQNPAKFRENSKLAGQTHPRSSILMSIESA